MSSFCSFATTIKHIDECDRSHILFISLFLISHICLLTEIRVKYLSKKVSPFNWTRNVFGEDPLYLLIYFRFSYLVCLWLILKWIWPEFDNFWLKIQLSVLNEIIIYWIINILSWWVLLADIAKIQYWMEENRNEVGSLLHRYVRRGIECNKRHFQGSWPFNK